MKDEEKKMIESIECEFIDPSKDYRKPLNQFKVIHGNLLINRGRTKLNDGWEILIPKNRLNECDWISHMRQKSYMDFGEFVCAYLKACELAGIKNLNISIYGFNYACKYADET